MTRYVNVKVNVSEEQQKKIKHAAQSGSAVSIQLSHNDLSGEHVLALTQAQVNKLVKACQSGNGVTIKMSKAQLEYNAKVEGGFLQMLLPMLATAGRFLLSNVLPSIATNALAGLASGSGVMYLKKNGVGCKIIPAGQGLFLAPWHKGNSISGSGLYMKTGSGYVDGSGLLLGPNSPFKNIPILGMIL